MLPRYDVARQVLIPGLTLATELRGMFGYFTSGVLVDLAPGLAEYLTRVGARPVRFVVSPEILEDDYKAIEQGTEERIAILERRMMELLGSPQVTASALATHTLACLAWLLASNRLEIRVAFLRHRYHPKVWLLSDRSGTICARGSGNATGAALHGNIENLDVDCSWVKGSADRVRTFVEEFEAQWENESEFMQVYTLAEAVRNEWLSRYSPEAAPTPHDYEHAFDQDLSRRAETSAAERQGLFRIPPGIVWRGGQYAHQGEAVSRYETAGRRGVLEMATGAGKTIAALIVAQRLYREQGKLLMVVAAPSTALVLQWAREAQAFGLSPVLPTVAGSRQRKLHLVARALRRLRRGASTVECLIVTNNLLTDEMFRSRLEDVRISSLLIADEVHNLGAGRFTSNPPEAFAFRLGLSATPIRQFDEPGTAELFNYFGGVVYRYGLDQAIGNCLVPYDYHIHEAQLTGLELEEWFALTERIAANRWRAERDEDDFVLQSLYRKRRRLVENAASKIPVLQTVLEEIGPKSLRDTLVYASSKNPDQLREVRAVLANLNVRFHQVTQEESAKPQRLQALFGAFANGALQVLISKKVLDEGINLPSIRRALILASTTVEREWVQRRGRVLRRAPGKDHAAIHDFLVIPPVGELDGVGDPRPLLSSELDRIEGFAELARNATNVDGPLAVHHRLLMKYFTEEGGSGHAS